nr:PREDICTED: uncharacterized protein LOC109044703 [Bemisia tabaci]
MKFLHIFAVFYYIIILKILSHHLTEAMQFSHSLSKGKTFLLSNLSSRTRQSSASIGGSSFRTDGSTVDDTETPRQGATSGLMLNKSISSKLKSVFSKKYSHLSKEEKEELQKKRDAEDFRRAYASRTSYRHEKKWRECWHHCRDSYGYFVDPRTLVSHTIAEEELIIENQCIFTNLKCVCKLSQPLSDLFLFWRLQLGDFREMNMNFKRKEVFELLKVEGVQVYGREDLKKLVFDSFHKLGVAYDEESKVEAEKRLWRARQKKTAAQNTQSKRESSQRLELEEDEKETESELEVGSPRISSGSSPRRSPEVRARQRPLDLHGVSLATEPYSNA